MTTRHLAVITVALLGMEAQLLTLASTLQLNARQLFEQAVTRNLELAGEHIELATGELFEDDGPASGHSYQKPDNREILTAQTWIKKELIIPNPAARAAFLVILSEEPAQVRINGAPVSLGQSQSGRTLHQAYAIDPKLLRPGRNDFVLHGSGKVWIARDDEFALGSRTRTKHPNRSAKSTDAGHTWDYDHLGPNGQLDGEYGVRLFLEHYRPLGTLTTAVLDAGNLEEDPVGHPLSRLAPVQVALAAEAGNAGHTQLRVRTGETYVPDATHWSEWEALGESEGVLERPRGRYLQIAVNLSSSDPLQSPQLKSLRIETAVAPSPDWTARWRVLDQHNERIIRSSIPFEYEPLDHPQLKQLREQYKLDSIVSGAHGDLDLMLRLAQWACNYWDWPNHISECYPPWDALQILKPFADGKPTGGFCLQFNLAFLQACESFGFPGRAISISQGRLQEQHPGGGHEIVELWSNEWKKWVYVDGALAWYVVDEKTGVPLSMLELRARQLQSLRGEPFAPVRVVEAERTRNKQFAWNGIAAPKPLNWYLELRMIPRSNFLQEKSPVPLNQGTEEWSWTGHYVWTDSEVPAGYLFSNRVSKRADFDWTLNQAHFVLEASSQPGRFLVHLDTETPSFDTFLAEIDGGAKKPVPATFSWTLHPGKNQLRVRPRNLAGREGIPSWISLEEGN